MNVTADARQLASAVSTALRACERNSKIPMLTHLRLGAADGSLNVVGTDLNIAVEVSVPADIHGEGIAVVPGQPLAALIQSMPGAVWIALEDGGATIKCGRSRFRLPTLEASDFPVPLALDGDAITWELTAADVATLAKVSLAAASEDNRYYLNGTNLHALDGKLAMVATDGHTLIIDRTEIPYPDAPWASNGIIVPRDAISEIIRIGIKAGVTLRSDSKKIEAMAGPTRLTSRLIDASYPAYRRLLPEPASDGITVEIAAFAQALERLAAVGANQKFGAVASLTWNQEAVPSEFGLTLARCESGEGEEVIEAEVTGTRSVGFSVRKMTALLGVLKVQKVRLSLETPASPIRIDPCDRPSMMALVMPVCI
jgi:DNA polymerase-3 subunit beta